MSTEQPSTVVIKLTLGREAIVDDANDPLLVGYNWCAERCGRGNYYVVAKKNGKRVRMHRLLMNAPSGMVVDHINGNTLDNRRANLRLATNSQNSMNTKVRSKSGYRGVSQHPRTKAWIANLQLGSYPTAEEAAKAHDKIVKMLRGEFATLNFPE